MRHFTASDPGALRIAATGVVTAWAENWDCSRSPGHAEVHRAISDLEEALGAAESVASGWISVEDRLPDDDRCVPVWAVDTDEDEDEGLWFEGCWTGERWEGFDDLPVGGRGTKNRDSWLVLYWYDLPGLSEIKWRNGAVVTEPTAREDECPTR